MEDEHATRTPNSLKGQGIRCVLFPSVLHPRQWSRRLATTQRWRNFATAIMATANAANVRHRNGSRRWSGDSWNRIGRQLPLSADPWRFCDVLRDNITDRLDRTVRSRAAAQSATTRRLFNIGSEPLHLTPNPAPTLRRRGVQYFLVDRFVFFV